MAPKRRAKILFLRKFSEEDTRCLKKGLSGYYELIIPGDFSQENLSRLAKDADVFLGHNISKTMMDSAGKLKLIQLMGAGIDKFDLGLLEGRRVALCNSVSNTPYVAEYAVSLLLSLVKAIPIHDRSMREGKWFKPKMGADDSPYLSNTLLGKTVGILGFGNVGSGIANLLKGFGTLFMVYAKERKAVPRSIRVRSSSLKKLLSESDFIFVTLPLTRDTVNLISSREFGIMKTGAYIVNVSRGPIVNEKSLYDALRSRRIAGAAIDVWYDDVYADGDRKYPSKNYPFHTLDNIILSPYRAGYIKGRSPHLEDVIKNLRLFAQGKKPINIIDIKKGY